jgi:uncharacterized protein (TIGR04255 family)
MPGPALPQTEYEQFKNPPLRAMLGQAQFPPILRLQKGVEAIADFQEAIRDLFPGFGLEQQFEITISAGQETEAATERSAAFRFINEEETWSALLAPTALTLEAAAGGSYSSYKSFSELFRTLWVALVKHLRPGRINQQGLRYVDHLEGDHSASEWSEWINPELLGGIAGEVLSPGLERSVCELLYPQEDGRLTFRHGITRAGPDNSKGFLLDFDSIHTTPVPAEDVDQLMKRFDESHDRLYKFFRWCVTEKALEEFRDGS